MRNGRRQTGPLPESSSQTRSPGGSDAAASFNKEPEGAEKMRLAVAVLAVAAASGLSLGPLRARPARAQRIAMSVSDGQRRSPRGARGPKDTAPPSQGRRPSGKGGGGDRKVIAFNRELARLCSGGQLERARALLEGELGVGAELRPDVVSFTTVISSLVRSGQSEDALHLFRRMESAGIPPNVYTYTAIIELLCGEGEFDTVTMYLDEMDKNNVAPNCHTFGCLVRGYSRAGRTADAVGVLDAMVDRGIIPNLVVVNCALHACAEASPPDPTTARRIYFRALEMFSVQPDAYTFGPLVRAHALAGDLRGAEWCFKEAKRLDVKFTTTLYNQMAHAYGLHRRFYEAQHMLREMEVAGLQPDPFTYSTLIAAAGRAHKPRLDRAEELLASYRSAHGEPSIVVLNAMVNAYVEAGRVDDALAFLGTMEGDFGVSPQPQSYPAVMAALADAGRFAEALGLFDRLGGASGPPPPQKRQKRRRGAKGGGAPAGAVPQDLPIECYTAALSAARRQKDLPRVSSLLRSMTRSHGGFAHGPGAGAGGHPLKSILPGVIADAVASLPSDAAAELLVHTHAHLLGADAEVEGPAVALRRKARGGGGVSDADVVSALRGLLDASEAFGWREDIDRLLRELCFAGNAAVAAELAAQLLCAAEEERLRMLQKGAARGDAAPSPGREGREGAAALAGGPPALARPPPAPRAAAAEAREPRAESAAAEGDGGVRGDLAGGRAGREGGEGRRAAKGRSPRLVSLGPKSVALRRISGAKRGAALIYERYAMALRQARPADAGEGEGPEEDEMDRRIREAMRAADAAGEDADAPSEGDAPTAEGGGALMERAPSTGAVNGLFHAVGKSGGDGFARAMALFERLTRGGWVADEDSYRRLIYNAAAEDRPSAALALLRRMARSGLSANAKCFNGCISAVVRAGLPREAWKFLGRMLEEGVQPNGATYFWLAETVRQDGGEAPPAAGEKGPDGADAPAQQIEGGDALAALWAEEGIALAPAQLEGFVAACLNNGRRGAARQILSHGGPLGDLRGDSPLPLKMHNMNVTLAPTFALASQALQGLRADGHRPDLYTYNSLLSIAASDEGVLLTDADDGGAASAAPRAAGGAPMRRIARLYRNMQLEGLRPDCVTYNIVIAACVKGGDASQRGKALALFKDMARRGVEPDALTYGLLIRLIGEEGDKDACVSLYLDMLSRGIRPNAGVFNTLLNALAAGGGQTQAEAADKAAWCREEMRQWKVRPALRTYALLLGLSSGRLPLARSFWDEMLEDGIQPDRACLEHLLEALVVGEEPAAAAEVLAAQVAAGQTVPAERTLRLVVLGCIRQGELRTLQPLVRSLAAANVRMPPDLLEKIKQAIAAKM